MSSPSFKQGRFEVTVIIILYLDDVGVVLIVKGISFLAGCRLFVSTTALSTAQKMRTPGLLLRNDFLCRFLLPIREHFESTESERRRLMNR